MTAPQGFDPATTSTQVASCDEKATGTELGEVVALLGFFIAAITLTIGYLVGAVASSNGVDLTNSRTAELLLNIGMGAGVAVAGLGGLLVVIARVSGRDRRPSAGEDIN